MQPSHTVARPSQDALTSTDHSITNLSPAQTGLVSVIIPAYNGAKYITQAIESVLSQTYSNYEILVIDDGSTDNTREVLEPYLDRIQYIYQDNQGVAVARNQGIEMSRGEFIAFLDQDDFFLPYKLALQIACFQLQPNLGIVHGGWRRVNATGEKIADAQPWADVPTLDLEGWVQWKCVLLSAMMFRRNWLEKVRGLDPQFRQTDDVDLVLRLSLMGCEAAWVCQTVVCYREHEGNASRNIQVQAKEIVAVLDKFFALSNLPEHIRQLETHCRYYTLLWIASRFYSVGSFSGMAESLKESLNYKDIEGIKSADIEQNWLDTFSSLAAKRNEILNIELFTNLPEWKELHTYLELKQLKYDITKYKAVLEQRNEQLAQKTEKLAQLEAELQQVRDQFEQTQSLLYQTEAVLEQSQSQLHETERVLEESVEQLSQSQKEAKKFHLQLHQTQEELEKMQAQEDWLDSQVLAWMQAAQQLQEQFNQEKIWLEAQSQAWMQAAQQ